jgi:hypothetical protein
MSADMTTEHVIVPREATQEMVWAAEKAEVRHGLEDLKRGGKDPDLGFRAIYRAMITAAPQPSRDPVAHQGQPGLLPALPGAPRRAGASASASGMITLQERIEQLVTERGSLRAAALAIGIDAGYLSRLRSGEKVRPEAEKLRRMGLRRVVSYEMLDLATKGRR